MVKEGKGRSFKEKRAEYMRDYRKVVAKREGKGIVDFNTFMGHVAEQALQEGAPAAVMGIYKELLKFKAGMEKEGGIGISADEIAMRNLEAERQLREGGYFE